MSDGDASSTEKVFANNGEMGSRMNLKDWSQTPLGTVENWQQSLKTAVRLILNSRFPMFVWWGESLVNLYNDAYIPVLGNRHPEALGVPAAEIWSDIWETIKPQIDSVIKDGVATWNEELLLLMERKGFLEETYFTFSYSPVLDDLGNVGGLHCACIEDTARVLNRRRLQTLRSLSEQANQARTAGEACRIAAETLEVNPLDIPFALVYLLDEAGERAHLSGTSRIAPEQVLKHEIVIEDDRYWQFSKVMRTGKSRPVTVRGRKFGVHPRSSWGDPVDKALVLPIIKAGTKDSVTGFLAVGVSPRLEFNEDYRAFFELVAGHIATAVANSRALEEERRRAAALTELNRAKTEFFSNVSHEFRTPLTLMLAPLEDLLKQPEELSPNSLETLAVVRRNGLRLFKLVNNLLDFSRLEAGRAQARPEPTDLALYTADLASNFRSGIEKAGIRFEVDCQPLGRDVLVDQEMWEKIVLNLLSNAFKYTHSGEIKVSLEERAETVALRVSDTGVGIPEDHLPLIFERFHRVPGARGRTYEGTGIGLSLVGELVALLGGTISVASEPGKGSVFTVEIPKKTAETDPAFITRDQFADSLPPGDSVFQEDLFLNEIDVLLKNETGGRARLSSTKEGEAAATGEILLAEDNADMRDYIRRLLENAGYEVSAVGDGQAALAAVAERKPHLVLTDVMMPRLDGFGLIRALRENEATRMIPVVMLSARAGQEAEIDGLKAGADDYLFKPFSAGELLARVRSNLELARQRNEAGVSERKTAAKSKAPKYCSIKCSNASPTVL